MMTVTLEESELAVTLLETVRYLKEKDYVEFYQRHVAQCVIGPLEETLKTQLRSLGLDPGLFVTKHTLSDKYTLVPLSQIKVEVLHYVATINEEK